MHNVHDPDHLSEIDLNLLRVCDRIYAERSVGRAAIQLGLTQSAVSHGLHRLRALFSDALFVRAGLAMEPTPRAACGDLAWRRIAPEDDMLGPRGIRRDVLLPLTGYSALPRILKGTDLIATVPTVTRALWGTHGLAYFALPEQPRLGGGCRPDLNQVSGSLKPGTPRQRGASTRP